MISSGDSKPCEEWIFYSTCTFYMYSNWDWFTTYEIVSRGAMIIKNYEPCEIAKIGSVMIKMFDEGHHDT